MSNAHCAYQIVCLGLFVSWLCIVLTSNDEIYKAKIHQTDCIINNSTFNCSYYLKNDTVIPISKKTIDSLLHYENMLRNARILIVSAYLYGVTAISLIPKLYKYVVYEDRDNIQDTVCVCLFIMMFFQLFLTIKFS